MNRDPSGNEGFSLVEVFIGLLLLIIGILAFASLHVTSVRGNAFSHNLMQATYHAQDGLESLRNVSLDSSRLQAGNHVDPAVTVSGVLFDRSYVVVTNANLRRIDYSVRWNDGVNHQVVFSTLRSR